MGSRKEPKTTRKPEPPEQPGETDSGEVEIRFPSDFIRHPKKRAFLVAFAQCGNVIEASEAAKIVRTTPWLWRQRDPAFSKEYAIAQDMAGDLLEAEAFRRIREGWEKPVFHNGKQIGVVQEFSTTLLIFLIKGAKPEKYRDRIEHSGSVNVRAINERLMEGRERARLLAGEDDGMSDEARVV